jgi:hypothetical protein
MRASFLASLGLCTACFTFVDFELGAGAAGAGAGGPGGAGGGAGGQGGLGGLGGIGGEAGGSSSVVTVGGGQGGCAATICDSECVDLATSGAHCGACDHDCGGGACVGSLCEPFVLVRGQANIHGLTLDEMNAYFTTSSFGDGPNDVVASVPKVAGGVPKIFSDEEQAAQHVIVVGERVYWTIWQPGTVRSRPLDQSEPARTEWAEFGADPVFGIQARGDQVVFGRYEVGLYSFSAADESPPMLSVVVDGVTANPAIQAFPLFALDPSSDNVVFTVANSALGVRRYSPTGDPQLSPITSGDFNTWGMTQDANYYYYSDQGAGMGNGKLHRISKVTWQAEEMAVALNRPRGLAVDAEYVYVAEIDAVRRVSLNKVNGSFASLLLAPAQEATMIAVDEKYIYWTNYGAFGGTLSKLAKPL